MAISRDLGKIVSAFQEQGLLTGSTASSPFASTDQYSSGGSFTGRIIDRYDPEFGGQGGPLCMTVEPYAYLHSTRGSTQADMMLQLTVKLQHGASSAGGDMADYSTAQQPPTRTFFTTAQSTAHYNWTTGAFRGQTTPGVYDLTAAKQFVRVVVTALKNFTTTESTGFESTRIGAAMRFGGADELPHVANSTGVGSTSTSTST